MPFYDRNDILDNIISALANQFLVDIWGEPGIGKTSLLYEAKSILENQNPALRVFLVDMKVHSHARPPMSPVLYDLVTQFYRGAPPARTTLHLDAHRLVTKLIAEENCCVMFDATEALQTNQDFWDWLVDDLLIPLLAGGTVRLVFAGQHFAPLRHHSIRDARHIFELKGFDRAEPLIMQHFQACWLAARFNLIPADLQKLVDTVIQLSANHPAMIDQLTDYICQNFKGVLNEHFIHELYCKVIGPYTNQTLLNGIDEDWKEILKLASPFEHFNETFLWNYLPGVASPLASRFPPENNQGLFLRQYIDDIFKLYIHGMIRKDKGENYYNECIRWFLFQSMLYLEPENLFKAYMKARSTCEKMAQDVNYDRNSFNMYQSQANKHREDLRIAYRTAIDIRRKLAAEAIDNPEESAAHTGLADGYEQELNNLH